MNMKKVYGKIRWILILCIIVGFAQPSGATSVKEEQEKKEELQGNLADAKSIMKELEELKGDAEQYITAMDEKMAEIDAKVADVEGQIKEKRKEIKQTKKELKATKKEVKSQYAAMKIRIQYMYENGNQTFVDMFFSSKSLSEFLSRAEYVSQITEYDRDMLERLQKKQKEIEYISANLQKDKEELSKLRKTLKQDKVAVEELIAGKQAEMNLYDEEIATTESEMQALKEEIAAQNALIEELKEIERKRQESAQNNGGSSQVPSYDGGIFTWPLPSSYTISSEYGYRIDPISGEYQSYHNGLDIAAPSGSKIVAAHDGQVAWSYYSATAGNWIGIDHGNGLYTIYMHCSSSLVSEGQNVSAGETIGLVGSTGRSTGPHLHFSVRLDGNYVNPHDYLGQ